MPELPSLHALGVPALNEKLAHPLTTSHASKHACRLATFVSFVMRLVACTRKPFTGPWYPLPKQEKVVVVVVVVELTVLVVVTVVVDDVTEVLVLVVDVDVEVVVMQSSCWT